MVNTFLKTISGVWPMLLIVSVIILTIRITYLIYNKKKIEIHKELLMFCFIVYVLLLYYIFPS